MTRTKVQPLNKPITGKLSVIAEQLANSYQLLSLDLSGKFLLVTAVQLFTKLVQTRVFQKFQIVLDFFQNLIDSCFFFSLQFPLVHSRIHNELKSPQTFIVFFPQKDSWVKKIKREGGGYPHPFQFFFVDRQG